jgi:serine/threonine protein kinase
VSDAREAASGSERWRRVRALFDQAVELPAEGRRSFLDGLPEEERGLRGDVESLLASADGLGDFLAAPAAEDAGLAAARVPDAIGPYRVLRQIGAGGMGTVYLAERSDAEYRREVAIKVVQRGMGSDFILRRFRTERQILAALDHPNIARLFDGGTTEDGLPYFVMEHIVGEDLLAYAEARRLTVRERIALFREVCSAVAYAHQRLVVHRDLKPGNVIVTEEGVPKLLDFGLAKLLEPDSSGSGAEMTATGVRIFTPEYASPEQVRGGPVTTASDVYSLGVVLYRLLTGQSPYRVPTRSPEAISRAVLEQDPVRPSSATVSGARALRGDLDTIVARALRKEPERRYGSAEQLSEDLRRYLEGLPVHARRGTLRYRTAKFVRRHTGGLAAAALLVLSLVGGLAASLWQMRQARHERDHAQLEAAKAREVTAFVRRLFESSGPRRMRGEKLSVQDVLQAGAARVDRELADQPELQASLLALLASVYIDMGAFDRAEPLAERSVALRERVLGPDHPVTAESLTLLGTCRARRFDVEGARTVLRRAIAIRERAGLRDSALAESLNRLGTLEREVRRLSDAEALIRRAVSIEEERQGPNLHKWLSNLAIVEEDLGNFGQAQRLLERALEIGVRREGKVDVELDVTLINLATVLRDLEEFDRARELFEQAAAVDEAAFGRPAGYDLGQLGELLVATRDFPRAREVLERSRHSLETTLGPDHVAVARPVQYMGRLDLAQKRPREAMPLLRRALSIRERAGAIERDELAVNLVDLAAATDELEGPAAAEPILRRALAIQRDVLAAGHPQLVPSLTALGRVLRRLGRVEEAEPLLEEAVRISRSRLPERHSIRRAAEAALRDLHSAARRRSA